uniref:Uncharacterized protein n=1 Tax=Romanomermis culicivorax TaxID=13658 RepID=A0A915HRI6_ROMCU
MNALCVYLGQYAWQLSNQLCAPLATTSPYSPPPTTPLSSPFPRPCVGVDFVFILFPRLRFVHIKDIEGYLLLVPECWSEFRNAGKNLRNIEIQIQNRRIGH